MSQLGRDTTSSLRFSDLNRSISVSSSLAVYFSLCHVYGLIYRVHMYNVAVAVHFASGAAESLGLASGTGTDTTIQVKVSTNNFLVVLTDNRPLVKMFFFLENDSFSQRYFYSYGTSVVSRIIIISISVTKRSCHVICIQLLTLLFFST